MNCINCEKETDNPKFCSRSCSVSFNNRLQPKHKRNLDNYCVCGRRKSKTASVCIKCKPKKINYCDLCTRVIHTGHLKCNSCRTKIRRYRTKKAAVYYLGSKCIDCGYSGNPAAFEFHHKSNDKDFNIGSASNRSWEVVKNELDKCILLCSNCHRIRHSDYTNVKLIEAVDSYNGRILEW